MYKQTEPPLSVEKNKFGIGWNFFPFQSSYKMVSKYRSLFRDSCNPFVLDIIPGLYYYHSYSAWFSCISVSTERMEIGMNTTATPPAAEEKTEITAPAAPKETAETAAPAAPKKKKKKNPKLRKRIITGVVALVIVGAIVGGMVKFLTADNSSATITDAVVQLGSITSTVEGSGTAKAKDTSSITITTAGTVMDVYVKEGDYVEQGTHLFSIDSPNANDAVMKARSDLEAKQKEVDNLVEASNNLTVRAEFSGKLLETKKYESGVSISAGEVVAKLVDDKTMRLEQYYSYAYEKDITVGQSVSVSVPAMMEQVPGKVSEIHKVSRVSPEGSKLFLVVISVENKGTLTADMAASALISANGQSIYPYEQGKLAYNRSVDVQAKAGGKVISSNLLDYLDVTAGQVLMQIDGEDNALALYNAQQALKTAQEDLQKAEQNLQNLEAVAPISGTVMGLAISPGQEIEANTSVISISDTSSVTVTAQVDERNISYVKAGMPVTINQWGTEYSGMVESVSLTPQNNNGAAFYPATITVDNSMAAENGSTLMPGSSVTYSLVASESDGCMVLPIQCIKYVPDPNSETGETVSVVFLKTDTPPENALEGVDGTTLGIPAEGYYPVPVVTGIADKYNIEIKEGLAEGDTVFQNTTQDPNMFY